MKKIFTLAAIMMAIFLFAGNTFAQNKPPKSPKNIIIFISDGWGYNNVEATNYFMRGSAGSQVYQQFPQQFGMSTYPAKTKDSPALGYYKTGYNSDSAWRDFNYVKKGATGSAPAATSMAAGVKSYYKGIGVDVNHNPIENITERAAQLGKAAGVVTTVEWTHATPAAFVAHNVHRDHYDELGRDMLLDSKLNVIMGCGHPEYDNNGNPVSPTNYQYVGGQDAWANLSSGNSIYGVPSNSGNYTVQDVNGDSNPDPWTLVQNKQDFEALTTGETPLRVVGVAKAYETIQQSRSGENVQQAYADPFNTNVPSLETMTKAAINILDNNENGFFLMVEGGAIDWANHANQAGRMIEEQVDFDYAVESAIAWVQENSSWEETMIIVTGDHECGYITGPLQNDNTPDGNPVINNGIGVMPGLKYNSGGHTNSLIPFFAHGTGSELFSVFADEEDYYHGRYINNTEIGQVNFLLWPKPEQELSNPKNVIVMISDGWGKNNIEATNYYMGETQPFESFEISTFMSTYAAKSADSPDMSKWRTGYNSGLAWSDFNFVNINPTGSGPAATSMASGVKSYYKAIGVDIDHNPLENLTERAKQLGKAAGVVTSVEWTHATPAAFVAHNVHRDHYDELGREMLLDSKLDVIMGCGHPEYDNNGQPANNSFNYVGGEEAWQSLKSGSTTYTVASNNGNTLVRDIDYDGVPDAWTLVESPEDFQSLLTGETPKRVCGVARAFETLQQSRSGNNVQEAFADPFNEGVPSLVEMTKGALNVLDNNPNGLFLMVEGGAVDWANHANQAGRMIEEQDDFNKSVEAVIDWIETNSSWDETLLIVTGDHECGYITGPNNNDNSPITNPVVDNGTGNMPGLKYNSGGHTNQLIPFYAQGAGNQLFSLFNDEYDYIRGPFINNTELAQAIFIMWNGIGELPDRYQEITLDQGWSIMSSYMNPFVPPVEDVFSELTKLDEMIFLFNLEGIYWPSQNINMLENFDLMTGYKVKMANSSMLTIAGVPADVSEFTIEKGYAFLPILSTQPISSSDLFSPLGNDLHFVYDLTSGQVYWPAGGLYTLETLYPGKGYYIFVHEDVTINFDVNFKSEIVAQPSILEIPETGHSIFNTGVQHIISFAGAILENVNQGDIIIASNQQGLVAGATKYDLSNPALIVFGDDMTTEEQDGMIEGDIMLFSVIDAETGIDSELSLVFDSEQPNAGIFVPFGLSKVKSSITVVGESILQCANIYPNPSNGKINIFIVEITENIDVFVLNAQGQIVASEKLNAENTKSIDLSNLSKGVYFVKLISENEEHTRKLIIQ